MPRDGIIASLSLSLSLSTCLPILGYCSIVRGAVHFRKQSTGMQDCVQKKRNRGVILMMNHIIPWYGRVSDVSTHDDCEPPCVLLHIYNAERVYIYMHPSLGHPFSSHLSDARDNCSVIISRFPGFFPTWDPESPLRRFQSGTEWSFPIRGREGAVCATLNLVSCRFILFYFSLLISSAAPWPSSIPCPPGASVRGGGRSRCKAQTSGSDGNCSVSQALPTCMIPYYVRTYVHVHTDSAGGAEGGRRAWARECGPVVYTRGIEYPRM